jgi:hypothetical protein
VPLPMSAMNFQILPVSMWRCGSRPGEVVLHATGMAS